MGNYRFRLSDMVPNAWFYKLKDMSRIRSKSQTTKKKQTSSSSLSSSLSSSTLSSSSNPQKTQAQQPHNMSYKRKSYYFSRNLNHETLSKNPTSNNTKFSEPPRKSSKKRRNNTKKKTSNVSAGCSCSLESIWTKHGSIATPENCPNSPFSFSSSTSSSEQESSVHSPKTFDALIMSKCKVHSDILIDMRPMNKNEHGVDSVSKIDLPPIITKPKTLQDSTKGTKKNEEKTVHKSLTVKILKEAESTTSPKRRVSVSSTNGVKLRAKSPRIVSRKSVSSSTSLRRSSVGESFAVVKSSQDPQKDFKESMVEMIVENNIRNSKGLEELLACYLSLNSDQYHDLIIKVFKQIWFDVTDIQ